MKTRSRPAKVTKAASKEEEPTTTAATLSTAQKNPPKPFILPKGISDEARIVTLSNPATTKPNRYLFCPETGFHEFTKVAAPKSAPRSWLFTSPEHGQPEKASEANDDFASGYILQTADLFVSTPIDPLFLALPAVVPSAKKDSGRKERFLSIDEHLDKLEESSRHIKHLLKDAKARVVIEKGIGAVCDSVDACDENMYRFSEKKLMTAMLAKARRMIENGLPPSMEEKFVRPALQKPIMCIKQDQTVTQATTDIAIDSAVADPQTETVDSQSTIASTQLESQSSVDSSASVSTAATSLSVTNETPQSSIDAPPGVISALRLSTAFRFIMRSYVPKSLHGDLDEAFQNDPSTNSSEMNVHILYLEKLRKEAQALRSISDNIGRKRGLDDGAEFAREEKKRKKEEEDAKKKNESVALKRLKKVDTSGMKKLSAFFTKK